MAIAFPKVTAFEAAPIATGVAHAIVRVGAVADLQPYPTAVARRNEQSDPKEESCIMSVYTELMPPLPENDEIIDWAYQNGEIDGCTITAPASVSSEITSYLSVLTHWYETIDDKAAKQTNCGNPNMTLPLEAQCSTSRTVFFTDGSEKTVASTIYAPFSVPDGGQIVVGAAHRHLNTLNAAIILTVTIVAILLQ